MPLFSAPFNESRETYYGLIGTPEDARIIIKACDDELLPRMQRRLAGSEGSSIRSGSVFAWKSSSFKNWGGDGKQWGPGRDSGTFSIKDELTNRGVGLIRQSFRYENYRIMSFYSTSDPELLLFKQPSTDTLFKAIKLLDLSYKDSNIHLSNPTLSLAIEEMRLRTRTAPRAPTSITPKHTTLQSETNNASQLSVHSDTFSAPSFPAIGSERPLGADIIGGLSASNIAPLTHAIQPQAVEKSFSESTWANASAAYHTPGHANLSKESAKESADLSSFLPLTVPRDEQPNSSLKNWSHSGSNAWGNIVHPTSDVYNVLQLASAAPSEPRQVLVHVRGDVGTYLCNIGGQPEPQDMDLSLVEDGSLSVVRGDNVPTGWSIDYCGISNERFHDDNGIGWRSQKNENVTDEWPRKFVCCICSLRWNVIPLSRKLLRDDVTEAERNDLQVPSPSDTLKDPGFTRPQSSELHYYLDHKLTDEEPCIRGLCQTCRPIPFRPGEVTPIDCCPPEVTRPNHFKAIYRCIMDNCPFTTEQRRNMKAHLLSPEARGHKGFLVKLANQAMHGLILNEIDREISHRLMHLFNDLDNRGQKIIGHSGSRIPLPGDISSPAVSREHIQWMSHLGLHADNVHQRDFFDPDTGKFYYREYILDGVEAKANNVRIISHDTGKPAKSSSLLWD